MPRVLLVHQPVDGGVGRHVADLATGLIARGYAVTLCGPRWPERPEGSGGGAEHVDRVALDLRREVVPTVDLQALRRLTRVVREVRPDVIHAHSSKAGALARVARIARPRLPVLYTPHGYAFAGFFSGGFERLGYREIERALAPLATRVVCVCEAEAALAATVGPKRRVRVVYNGIERAVAGSADPRMSALRDRGPVVCALTQLRAGKGIETLIDATPNILRRHPQLQIAVWGDGPELAALRSRARAIGVGDAMHFLGATSDPAAALRGADIFVHPSLAESFPYVILEAMSLALPIVASDVGGVGEALVDGESGILVAPGHSHALSRALVECLDDADRRTRMGETARSRFEQHFTLERMLDRLTDVYEEVATTR